MVSVVSSTNELYCHCSSDVCNGEPAIYFHTSADIIISDTCRDKNKLKTGTKQEPRSR